MKYEGLFKVLYLQLWQSVVVLFTASMSWSESATTKDYKGMHPPPS